MCPALVTNCIFRNGGDLYGHSEHNSLTLLNKYYTKYPEDADKVVLNLKGTMRGIMLDSKL